MGLFDRMIVSSIPWAPRSLVRQVSSRYIAGETLAEALATVAELNRSGCMATLDILGEDVTCREDCRAAVPTYVDALRAIKDRGLDSNISIKLTALGLKLDVAFCEEMVREILNAAREQGNFVRIDMEDRTCTDDTLEIYYRVREAGYENVGIVVQARLRRCVEDVVRLARRGANVRVCKGIYVEPRSVAYQVPSIIVENFRWLMEILLEKGCYVGIATHDEQVVWRALHLIDRLRLTREQYEFQMLLGVDEELRRILVESGHRLRVYVPFGKSWYAYSTRRLKENPKIAGYVFKSILAGR